MIMEACKFSNEFRREPSEGKFVSTNYARTNKAPCTLLPSNMRLAVHLPHERRHQVALLAHG